MQTITETETLELETAKTLGSLLSPDGLPRVTDSKPSTPPSKPSLTQKHSPADKVLLTRALKQVCALQHQYGKTDAELETLVEGFSWVLSKYTMQQIIEAIGQYIQRNSNIPAPADIVNIIDPPPVELSAAVYVSLQKKCYSGGYLLASERKYCEDFRRQEMNRTRGGSDILREAESQVQQYRIAYDAGDA